MKKTKSKKKQNLAKLIARRHKSAQVKNLVSSKSDYHVHSKAFHALEITSSSPPFAEEMD